MKGYEQDFYEWTQETACAIASGRFEDIDRAALADEVQSLGSREKHEIRNRLKQILLHKLKWDYQPERQSRSWRSSIMNQQEELRDVFEDSPSLRGLLPEILPKSYERARRMASEETGIDLKHFPEACPWTLEEVING